jgi:hypothetical protein
LAAKAVSAWPKPCGGCWRGSRVGTGNNRSDATVDYDRFRN